MPSFFSAPADNQTAYAWTYVYSPKEQQVGAQIEFYTYSRSGSDTAPKAGQWDRRGSKIWLNGNEIPAPQWEQTDVTITQDHATQGLTNENFTAREPVSLTLKQGWNKVFLKLPHANKGGTSRDKWQFTFVITDTEGRNAVDGLIYSPDKSLTDEIPNEKEKGRPLASDDQYTYWYTLSTPKRGTRYTTSYGAEKEIIGDASATKASQWKFVSRTDGSLDIINRADGTYISPTSANNSALKTVVEQPSTGWNITSTPSEGYFIITSGTTEFNQTQAGLGYKVYNWGYNTTGFTNAFNNTDAGCLYVFNMVEIESSDPTPKPEVKTPKLSNEQTYYWYKFSSSRYSTRFPTSYGEGRAVVSESNANTNKSEWKFVDRGDGTFNIVNRADELYLSPIADNNKPLSTTATQPTDGWKFMECGIDNYYLLVSDGNHTEINQTKEKEGFQLYNWGYGSKVPGEYRLDDTGCQFSFILTDTESVSTAINSSHQLQQDVRVVNRRIVCSLPYRLYAIDGQALPIGRQLNAGVYLIRTAKNVTKIVVK